MKKISLDEILFSKRDLSYIEQAKYVYELIELGRIIPIKRSGYNGKSPRLPLAYKIVEEKKDYTDLINELKYEVSTKISLEYYLKHIDKYEKDRKWILRLSNYLENNTINKNVSISLNERSFQIWNREKFIQKEFGGRILSSCGVSINDLNIYNTTEPLAYYSTSKVVPQAILIVENKDTFYSIRKYMLEQSSKDKASIIFGLDIKTIVYGAGKGILRSIDDFTFCVEPYMNSKENKYIYFGDLDYEGIGIFEQLAKLFMSVHILIPFVEAYLIMLNKSKECIELPDTKEGQNKNISDLFFSYFDKEYIIKIKSILENGKYIPQEILNITDFIE